MQALALLAGLLLILLHCGVSPAQCGHIVSNGCNYVVNDTSRWLSVARGPGLGTNSNEIQQYWLSQNNVIGTNTQAQVTSTVVWSLPTRDVTPVNGLVLAYYTQFNGYDDVLRVLLQDAKNCFYDVLIPRLFPLSFTIQRNFCSSVTFGKILPDSNVDMRNVRNIYLISFDKVVVLALDNLAQVGFAKMPEGNIHVTSLVDASYQRNPGGSDALFIVRGTNQTGQPSEIINYQVGVTSQSVTLKFGHFTYLDGESDTMFINDNATDLFWTQVVINRDWGAKQGMLFDYGLASPHSFRYGNTPFSSQPYARWGAHAFSSLSQVNAMMITSTDSPPGQTGFTIQVVYLNASLPSLSFEDPLVVKDVVLPSFGQSISVSALTPDFAVVMAAQTGTGQLCLQLFMHCAYGAQNDCWS